MKIIYKTSIGLIIILQIFLGILFFILFNPYGEEKTFKIDDEYSVTMYEGFRLRKNETLEYAQFEFRKTPFIIVVEIHYLIGFTNFSLDKFINQAYGKNYIHKFEKADIPIYFTDPSTGGINADTGYYLYHNGKMLHIFSPGGRDQSVKELMDKILLSLRYKGEKIVNLSEDELHLNDIRITYNRRFIIALFVILFPIALLIFWVSIMELIGVTVPKDMKGYILRERSVEGLFIRKKRFIKKSFMIVSYALFSDNIAFYLLTFKFLEIPLKEIDRNSLEIGKGKFFSNRFVSFKVFEKKIKINIYSRKPEILLENLNRLLSR